MFTFSLFNKKVCYNIYIDNLFQMNDLDSINKLLITGQMTQNLTIISHRMAFINE